MGFTDSKGKERTRMLQEMPKLLADSMVKEYGKEKKKKEEPKPKPKPRSKMTKKERMKADLLGSLAPGFDSLSKALPENDKEAEMFRQQSENMMNQMINRAKLRPDTKVTLREFCDLVWRTGNASPLDPDDMFAEPKKPEDEDDDGDDSDLSEKIEL